MIRNDAEPPHETEEDEDPCRCVVLRQGKKLIVDAVLDEDTAEICKQYHGFELNRPPRFAFEADAEADAETVGEDSEFCEQAGLGDWGDK